jgi:hypothetical protein
MERLDDNWLTNGLMDFEYKKYLLLAYLQSVDKNFTSNRLYPYLGDLVRHYQNLSTILENKKRMAGFFPKELEAIDLKNFMLRYKAASQDDTLMAELERILDFSIPAIKRYLEEGKDIYEWIERCLNIQPVGVQPLQPFSGFLFLRNGAERQARVFQYTLTIFEQSNEKYRGISTTYINTYPTGITNTYESIKLGLIESHRLLVPPAVYVVESEIELPVAETLLPIAKRVLVRQLSLII